MAKTRVRCLSVAVRLLSTYSVVRFLIISTIIAMLPGESSAQQIKLVPSGGNVAGRVVVDADWIVVPLANSQGLPPVKFGFWHWNGSSWATSTLQPTLSGTGASTAVFDYEGDRLVIGNPHDPTAGSEAGVVLVYTRNPTTGNWSGPVKLFAPDAHVGDSLGSAVALDGDLIIAGAPGADNPLVNSGAAYAYGFNGSNWVFEGKLSPPISVQSGLAGRLVDASGKFAFVGPDVFERSGTFPFVAWNHAQTITLGQYEIALGAQAETLAFGFQTSVAIYHHDERASTWSYVQTVDTGDGAQGGLSNLSLSADGYQLIFGAPDWTPSGPPTGAAFIFGRHDGLWYRLKRETPSDQLPGFGSYVSQGDGGAVAARQMSPQYGAGAVYLFPTLPLPEMYCTAKVNSEGCLPAIDFVGSPFLSGKDDFVISASNVINNANGMLLWGTLPNSSPFAGGTLCVAPPLHRTPIQNSGGNPPPEDCSGTYAYLFSHDYCEVQGLLPGASVYAQYYSRDNGFPLPNNIGLTNAVKFVVLP